VNNGSGPPSSDLDDAPLRQQVRGRSWTVLDVLDLATDQKAGVANPFGCVPSRRPVPIKERAFVFSLWEPPGSEVSGIPTPEGDKLLFVFDGGIFEPEYLDEIQLPADELSAYEFHDPARAHDLTIARLARRIIYGTAARADGTVRYLEHGQPIGEPS
jgi:hypothetical protein